MDEEGIFLSGYFYHKMEDVICSLPVLFQDAT